MSYQVLTTQNFEKDVKKLYKKYKSIVKDIDDLICELRDNPTLGTYIGDNIYKIRISIKSKGKGRRGGARVLTLVKIQNEEVFLFSIYSKGRRDNMTKEEIQSLIKEIR